MQNLFVKAEELTDHVKEYVNNRIAAVKLQAAERMSKLLSDMVAIAIIAAIMLVFVIFLSLGIAYGLGEWLGELYVGFLVVAGFWLFVALLIWANKESLLRLPIMDKMLKEMFRNEEHS